jgi:hypothetical protein
MSELTPEPDSTGGESQKKKKKSIFIYELTLIIEAPA